MNFLINLTLPDTCQSEKHQWSHKDVSTVFVPHLSKSKLKDAFYLVFVQSDISLPSINII